MLDIEGCTRLGLGVTSADSDAIIDRLDPSCHKLRGCLAAFFKLKDRTQDRIVKESIRGISHIW